MLPSFLFVVGASLAMTVDRLSWARVARRSALLYALGLLLTGLRPLGVLHRACGSELVGVEREVGRKFGRWLDVVLMQRLL